MPNVIPFQFGDKEVRVYLDEKGEPWWEAQNVCDVLDIRDASKAVSRLRSREKRSESRNLLIINESGLYRLIMRSNKPAAQRFQDWVFDEVLPSIRKTGTYQLPQASPIDKYPELRAIQELILSVAEARDIAQAAQLKADQANANALRALESQLFFTIAEYVYSNKLQPQIPDNAYKPLSDHLRLFCLDRNIPFRKIGVGGKRWEEEYAFHISVYVEVVPGWLSRRFAQEHLRTLHTVKERRP